MKVWRWIVGRGRFLTAIILLQILEVVAFVYIYHHGHPTGPGGKGVGFGDTAVKLSAAVIGLIGVFVTVGMQRQLANKVSQQARSQSLEARDTSIYAPLVASAVSYRAATRSAVSIRSLLASEEKSRKARPDRSATAESDFRYESLLATSESADAGESEARTQLDLALAEVRRIGSKEVVTAAETLLQVLSAGGDGEKELKALTERAK